LAPTKILRDRELVALAQSGVKSSDDILAQRRRLSRAEAARLFRAYRKASRLGVEELPGRSERGRPKRSEFNPAEVKERVAALKAAMSELSEELTIPHDVLLQPAIVKSLAAESSVDVEAYLAEAGARPWQIELSAPVLKKALAGLPPARTHTARREL
ncbi:MAG: HRDC domain-containing protein, partial [Brevibacterium linens]